jgi:hypothetical protein
MRANGNLHQWSAPGFPRLDLLQRDLDRGGAFVIESSVTPDSPSVTPDSPYTIPDRSSVTPDDPSVLRDKPSVIPSGAEGGAKESPVGYFALLPSPEPTYENIDGAWLTDGPYGVIHRIASYPGVHGIFSAVIAYAAQRYAHLRIDTHRDNRIMQHLIEKHGFTYCGIIWLEDGSERLAYER